MSGCPAQGGAPPVVTLRQLDDARLLLRARGATTQAGFTAERIPQALFPRRPILIDDGEAHDAHRAQLVRHFAPARLDARHRDAIEAMADRMVADAVRTGSCEVDRLALSFSVAAASRIVGLTESDPAGLERRLEAFLRQPPVDHTRPDHGRTRGEWARAGRDALLPLLRFAWHDVRPAIRARRRRPQDDIISMLLERGHRDREIVVECLTYGTAGMVTTREFMSMCVWRLLEDDALRDAYLAGEREARFAILSEVIRLEPPVARLYRRVQGEADGCPYAAGTLVEIDVRTANVDPERFSPSPHEPTPDRRLRAADRTGLSFGDGAHRCPGSHLALLETDALVRALLAAAPRLEGRPQEGFDTLVQGYRLRGLRLTFR